MISSLSRRAGAFAILLCAAPALAHPGHEATSSGFLAGLIHPLTGLDHLAAMLMIGLWSALTAKRHGLALPSAFLAAMLAGFTHGHLMPALPLTEALVIASVFVAAAALALNLRAPATIAIALVALFGFAHGEAHGMELPDGASTIRFAAGFTISAAALLAAGIGAGRLARRHAVIARCAGALGMAGVGWMLATG